MESYNRNEFQAGQWLAAVMAVATVCGLVVLGLALACASCAGELFR